VFIVRVDKWEGTLPQPNYHLATAHQTPAQHLTSRSTYPHYHLHTEPIMAMALQLTEEVNAMGWPPYQSHLKICIHGIFPASVDSFTHSHTSPLAPHSPISILLHLWFEFIPLLHHRFVFIPPLHLYFVFSPPLLFFFKIPWQRGKSMCGAAWYNTRGQGS